MKVKITNPNEFDVSFAQVGKIPKKSSIEKELRPCVYYWLKRSAKVTIEEIKVKVKKTPAPTEPPTEPEPTPTKTPTTPTKTVDETSAKKDSSK